MKVIEEPQLEVKTKWPAFIDVLLYPFSIAGMVHLTIFVILPVLFSYVNKMLYLLFFLFVKEGAAYISGFFAIVFYFFFVGYFIYYLANCVIHSSKGNRRAADVALQDVPSKDEFISKMLLLLGSAAISFWPAAIYYAFVIEKNSVFWILFAVSGFVFPMSLLTAAMFDTFDALNPVIIISSIFNTFWSYCCVIFYIGLMIAVMMSCSYFSVWWFIVKIINIYLLFVFMHILGRFYWFNKYKLNWGL